MMRRIPCRWFPLIAAAVLTSCGGASYVILEISSDLLVPAQADRLVILTTDPATGAGHAEIDIAMGDNDSFPVDVLLDLGAEVPARLRHEVRAQLGDDVVARVAVEHDWSANRTTRVRLPALSSP